MRETGEKKLKKIILKCIAGTMAFNLCATSFVPCIGYAVSYASSISINGELNNQTDTTLSKNVKFDAFFEENNSISHYKTGDINSNSTKLIFKILVQKNGYLKNATISIKNEKGENDINFSIDTLEDEKAIVQSASDNELVLRKINAENDVYLGAIIRASAGENVSADLLSGITKITLRGLYINEKGVETPIEKEIKISLDWVGKYEALVKQSLIKYIPIENNEKKEMLVSVKLETGLNDRQFMIPVKNTNMQISIPKINNIKPRDIEVIALSTTATNGRTSQNIIWSNDNYSIDNEKEVINILLQNELKEKSYGKDEYIINYIFDEELFKEIENKNVPFESNVKLNIETYDNTIASTESTETITLYKTIGKLVSFNGAKITESISKGNFYANINSQEKTYTEYETKWDIDITNTDKLSEIMFEDLNTYLVSNEKEINVTDKVLYKQLTFNSQAFEELFGEDGKVYIYDKENFLIGIVAKDTRTNKNGDYIIDFYSDVSNIYLKTTKPVKSGNLVITMKKEILNNIKLDKSQIDRLEGIKMTAKLIQKDLISMENIEIETKEIYIPLDSTVTKSSIYINRDKLSTLVKNENVEMTIELGNYNDDSDLYIDPIFDIELPSCVQDVEILDAKILFDEELLIDSVKYITKNDKPVIEIKLNGVQTKYSKGTVTNGTNIILNTNLVVDRLTPSYTDEIKMYYYNSNFSSYANGVETEKGYAGLDTTKIEFVAPSGMIMLNGIYNYDGNNNYIYTIENNDELKQVETYRPAKIATMHLTAVNNTGNTCSDVVILGRIPFKGNKSITKKIDLGTTIDTYLRGYINVINENSNFNEKIKIYYSENGEASTSLSDTNNMWTENPLDLSKVKSYMIVLEDYELEQGKNLEFTYDFEIPANIAYNQTINSNYGIYYINNTQVASISSSAESGIVGITTGRGPELSLEQVVEGAGEDGTIGLYKVLKYKISVTNIGTEDALNVSIQNKLPKWTTLVRPIGNRVAYSSCERYISTNDREEMASWNVIENATDVIGSTPTVGWVINTIAPGETVERFVYIIMEQMPDIYSFYKDYPGFTIGEDGKYYIQTSRYDVDTDTTFNVQNEITAVPNIDVTNIIYVGASNINAILKGETEPVEVKENSMLLTEDCSEMEGEDAYKLEGGKIGFSIGIGNTGETDLENVVVEKVLPEGLEFESGYLVRYDESFKEVGQRYLAKYNKETRTVSINVGTVKGTTLDIENLIATSDSLGGVITVIASNLEEGVYEKHIKTNTKVYADSVLMDTSEPIEVTILKPHYTFDFLCTNKSAILDVGEEIEYYITIKNVGKLAVPNLKVKLHLPNIFKVQDSYYTFLGNLVSANTDYEGNVSSIISIPENETAVLYVRIKVGKNEKEENTTVYAELSGDNLDFNYTDFIVQKVEAPKKEEKQNIPGEDVPPEYYEEEGNQEEQIEKRYKIAGSVWLDDNEDGIKDSNEVYLENIKVFAINTDTGEVAKTKEGEEIIDVTDTIGSYLLTNLQKGSYIVAFEYNNKIYEATKYQSEKTSSFYNSDGIEKQININNEIKTLAVTDSMNIASSISSIDLGLIQKAKFDLKTEMGVSKITVQNEKGISNYEYDFVSLAKVEIPSSQMNKSMVVIEYLIKITNEGNTAGYATELIDYKPQELIFNSNLNPDWYEGNDGNIYTRALENTIINPGETKEIKLLLTKTLSTTFSGIINNTIEINESYNELGLVDRDSVSGNNAQGEDDIALSDTIIITKTGSTPMYISLTIFILILISLGIVTTKEYIGNKKEEVFK